MAAAAYFDQIQKIYIAFYQRPADPAGLRHWADKVNDAGGDLSPLINTFATSPEAVRLYGTIDASTIGSVITHEAQRSSVSISSVKSPGSAM